VIYELLVYFGGFFFTFVTLYYTIHLFLKKEFELISKKIEEWPKVAIIVPAYNEEKSIKESIFSLANLDYPKDKLKIIVVNDGSTDKTSFLAKEAAKEINKKHPQLVEVYDKENGGKASALNFGIKKVMNKVDYVVVLDADSVVEKDSLKKIVKRMESLPEEYAAAVSTMNVYKPETFHQRFAAVEYFMVNVFRKALSRANLLYVTPGPFSIYRIGFFKKHGFFNEKDITEDMEMGIRIRAKGYKIFYEDESLVYTISPPTFKTLWKQRLRWYLGGLDNYLKYIKALSKREKHIVLAIIIPFFIALPYLLALSYNYISNYVRPIYYFIKDIIILKTDYYYILKADIENFKLNFSFNFSVQDYFLMLFLIITFTYLFLSKKYIKFKDLSWFKSKAKFLFYIIVFVFLYFFYQTFFYLSVLYYKLFGKRLKFGGTIWENSLRNKLTKKLKSLRKLSL